MPDFAGDEVIDHLDRFMQDPAQRARLESNCSLAWESLQSAFQSLLLHRALRWIRLLFDLHGAGAFQDDPAVQKWVLNKFVVVAFARFRSRCLSKPPDDRRKGGMPDGSPSRFLLRILWTTLISQGLTRADGEPVPPPIALARTDTEGILDRVLRRERLQLLRQCMERLTDQHMRAIEETYLKREVERTIDELAKRAGVTRQTYHEWLREAKVSLRKCIESKESRFRNSGVTFA